MEILDADDFIQLLVESGVPLIQGRVPVTIYDKPTQKATKPTLPTGSPYESLQFRIMYIMLNRLKVICEVFPTTCCLLVQ